MAYTEVGGTQVHYLVDGQGPGLILIHGTGADARSNWEHLVADLVADNTLLRPDYSGSGGTRDDEGPLSLPLLASQVMAAADAAGLDAFDVAGYSLGACIAVQMAADHPGRVRSLTLLGGLISGDDVRLQLEFGLWQHLIHTDRPALARLILLTGFSPDFLASWSPQQIEETLQLILEGNWWEGMARQVALDLTLDIRALLPAVSCPTLVIGCEHDQMVPPAHARALAAAIARARYAELPAGHLAPLECPGAFVSMLRDFVDEVRRQGG